MYVLCENLLHKKNVKKCLSVYILDLFFWSSSKAGYQFLFWYWGWELFFKCWCSCDIYWIITVSLMFIFYKEINRAYHAILRIKQVHFLQLGIFWNSFQAKGGYASLKNIFPNLYWSPGFQEKYTSYRNSKYNFQEKILFLLMRSHSTFYWEQNKYGNHCAIKFSWTVMKVTHMFYHILLTWYNS